MTKDTDAGRLTQSVADPALVTQADREAAADYLSALVPTMPDLSVRVRDGQTALARAFARHRLAAIRETTEKAAKFVDTIEPDEDAGGGSASWGDFVQIVQTALRCNEHLGEM